MSIKKWIMGAPRFTAYFIDHADHVHKRTVYPEGDKIEVSFGGQKHVYIVDKNAMFYDKKHRPIIYYNISDPLPLNISGNPSNDIHPEGLRDVLEHKMVKDLFKMDGDKILMVLLILIAINLMATVVIILKITGVLKIGTP